jgi:PTS system nitrogen regulatory IIA component
MSSENTQEGTMTSETSLHGDSIALAAGVATADAVLRRLSELAKLNPLAAGLTERAIYRGLKDREKLGSTGLGHGVAIPHFATDDVDDFIVALLTTSAAVDFNGLDGKPSDVFVCIVGPRSQRDRHIKLLSALSKFLSAPGSLDNLRRETDPATIRSLLSPALDIEDEPSGRDRVLFQIFMQNLDHFEDVLNLFSSVGRVLV